MIARYPGRCVITGAPIRPGDSVRWDYILLGRVLIPCVPAAPPPDPPTRAQISRRARNRTGGPGLDHELE